MSDLKIFDLKIFDLKMFDLKEHGASERHHGWMAAGKGWLAGDAYEASAPDRLVWWTVLAVKAMMHGRLFAQSVRSPISQ